MSLIDLYTKSDANPDARVTPSATAQQLFDAARRDWLASRHIFGETHDATFNSYVARRGGLSEAEERALAAEAAEFFKGKREASEKAVIREREIGEARNMAGRCATIAETSRIDWVERHLAGFLRVADELRAIANEIQAARGTRATSMFMPGQAPIADDAAIVALSERIGQRLNAAGAVVKLTGNDAAARMRMEKVK